MRKHELRAYLAVELAEQKHAGQKYGNTDYFRGHVVKVATKVAELSHQYPEIDQAKFNAVAYLHDIVEDTDVTLEDIKEQFGREIAFSVDCITKREGEDYNDYLIRVVQDQAALIVKRADALCNLTASMAAKDKRRVQKYLDVISFLSA